MRHFDLLTTDLDHALVVCDLLNMSVELILGAIQGLCNADGGGGVTFSGKSVTVV